MEVIKDLGTNGGGFFNVNAAHPFENPNAFTALLIILCEISLGAGLFYMFGKMVGDTRQGWALLDCLGYPLNSRPNGDNSF